MWYLDSLTTVAPQNFDLQNEGQETMQALVMSLDYRPRPLTGMCSFRIAVPELQLPFGYLNARF